MKHVQQGTVNFVLEFQLLTVRHAGTQSTKIGSTNLGFAMLDCTVKIPRWHPLEKYRV